MTRTELSRLLKKKVDLSSLLDSLDFTDEQIVDASKVQPLLFMEAARYRAKAMRKRSRLEAALSVARAERAGKFRSSKKEVGDRVTEGQVQERLNKDPTIASLQASVDEAEVEEEYAKLLLEGFRMRRDALKVVADVIGAEIYVSKISSGQMTELRKIKRRLEDKYPGQKRHKHRSS